MTADVMFNPSWKVGWHTCCPIHVMSLRIVSRTLRRRGDVWELMWCSAGGTGPAGRGSDWARGPELIGDSLSGFDDDQPFEDQVPRRGRGPNDGGPPRSLLMGARDAMPFDQPVGLPDRLGQTSASSRRMPSGGLPEYSSMSRSKR